MSDLPKHKCPVCGSDDVRGSRMALERKPENSPMATVTQFEFFCGNCHTLERKSNDEAGFDAWYQRWWA